MKLFEQHKDLEGSQEVKPSENYKYRKNSTLYFKSKFKPPPLGLFDAIAPSYGQGVGIYFDLIQQLFAIFLVMFIISIGCIYLNINADGIYGEFKLELDVISIANMPIFLSTASSAMSDTQKSDSQMRMNIYYICDCAYSLIFFLYLLYARSSTYKKVAKLKETSDSIKYFTVSVTGFPENIINAYDIKNHFERIEEHKFTVVECILQRNYSDTLRFQQEKLILQQKLEIQLNRSDLLQEKTKEDVTRRDDNLEELKEKILEVDEKIKKHINSNLSHEQLSSVKAFVTFSTRKERDYALTLFENWGGLQDPKLKYKQLYALTVSKAEDPSCIIWENQDATLPDIYAQKLLSFIVGLIISIVVLINLLIFSYYYKSTWRVDQYTCLINSSMTKTDPRYEQCLCMKGSTFTADPTITCSDSYSVSIPNTLFGLIMSILLFFIRIFMDVIITKERHNSSVQQTKSIFLSIFFWMTLNSILFIFFFQFTFDNQSVSLLKYFSYIIPPFKNSEDVMKILFPYDVDKNWVINVGYKITLISLFNTLLPQILIIGVNLVVEWFKEQKQEKKRIDFIIDRNPSLNLRKDHPELNKNHLFSLPDKYAQLAFTCYLGFIFAGPTPILLLITSLSLCFQIFFDRYMLIRYNSFDVIQNQRLEVEYAKFGSHFLKWMPWCVVLHLLFSLYNYASPSIFPNIQALNIIVGDSTISDQFVQRLAKSIILSGLLGLVLIVLILTDVFKLNGCLKKKKRRENIQVVDEEKAFSYDSYINSLKKIQDQGKLITYDIAENEDYVEIIDLINQESEKAGKKILSNLDQNQIDMQVNLMADNNNQSSQLNGGGASEKQSNIFLKKSRRQIHENDDLNNNEKLLNQSQLHESNIKVDQSGMDNSIINPNNLSSAQINEEDPIISKRNNSKYNITPEKLSQRELDQSRQNKSKIQEEDGEQSPTVTVKDSNNQGKMTQMKASQNNSQQATTRKKKKKLKLKDAEIQSIIKDYQ